MIFHAYSLADTGENDTSLATGFPARAITISSPAAACSVKRYVGFGLMNINGLHNKLLIIDRAKLSQP